MKVAVIYDFATHPGGGDFVMLNILQAIDLEADLLTPQPRGLQKSANFFKVEISAVNFRHMKLPPYFKHPDSMAYNATN